MAGISLVGCQGEGVPGDAQLNLSPEDTSISVFSDRDPDSPCVYQSGNYTDFPLLIRLSTVNGSPLGNVDVVVHARLTGQTGSQIPLIDLYRDVNSNGVIDDEDELLSQPGDPLPVVKTGQWTGTGSLLVRANLSCGYRATVHAIAEGISGFASVEVKEVDRSYSAFLTDQSDLPGLNAPGRFNANR